jgi:autotransporter-associated beta strand protein
MIGFFCNGIEKAISTNQRSIMKSMHHHFSSHFVTRAVTAAAVILAAGATASAATSVWVGGAGASFSNAANWQTELGAPGTVPGSADIAAFTDLAPGSGAFSVDTGADPRTIGQLRFGTNTPTATSPALTRAVTISGSTITLPGVAGGGSNIIGAARPAGSTGAVTIDNDLLLAGGNGTPPDARFNIEAGDPFTINGDVGETGGSWGLRKVGAGTLVLNGDTSYTGITIAQTGLLVINGNATGNGAYSVQANGTLAGTGSITGTITVSGASSFLVPSLQGAIGTLSVTGPVSFNSGTLRVDVDGSSSGSADKLAISGALTLTNNSKLTLDLLSPLDDAAYVVASYGSLTGTYQSANITGLPAGYGLDYNYNGLHQLAVVAVPEPSVILPAFAALLVLGRRRR